MKLRPNRHPQLRPVNSRPKETRLKFIFFRRVDQDYFQRVGNGEEERGMADNLAPDDLSLRKTHSMTLQRVVLLGVIALLAIRLIWRLFIES